MVKSPLRKAVELAGGQTALAAKIGSTQGHVSKWLERDFVPPEFVLAIERATGVSRYELRPDVYSEEISGFAEESPQKIRMGGYTAADLIAMKPRWTVAEIDALQEAGNLEQERWELIEGIITPMQSKGDWHEPMKGALTMFWVKHLPEEYALITETSFRFTVDTLLEPDFTFYLKSIGWRGMTGGNVPFVVEVADTSLRYDLKRKQRLYAGFGIREMWVINARTKITHVHRSPTANGYADIKTFQPEDFIAPQFSEALGLKLSELEIY